MPHRNKQITNADNNSENTSRDILPADLPLDHTITFDRSVKSSASLAVNVSSNDGFSFAHLFVKRWI
jgi:hypothetical protein